MSDESRRVSERNLQRIADALGIPVEDLFLGVDTSRPSAEEVTELLAAFSAVRDPGVRRRCIALLEAASEASRGKGETGET